MKKSKKLMILAGISLLVSAATSSTQLSEFFYVGAGLVVVAAIYGFVRPFTYDTALAKKKGTWYAGSTHKDNPLDHIEIAIVPGNTGIRTVNLGYTFSY
jgi:hypothetical protein